MQLRSVIVFASFAVVAPVAGNGCTISAPKVSVPTGTSSGGGSTDGGACGTGTPTFTGTVTFTSVSGANLTNASGVTANGNGTGGDGGVQLTTPPADAIGLELLMGELTHASTGYQGYALELTAIGEQASTAGTTMPVTAFTTTANQSPGTVWLQYGETQIQCNAGGQCAEGTLSWASTGTGSMTVNCGGYYPSVTFTNVGMGPVAVNAGLGTNPATGTFVMSGTITYNSN